MHKKFGRPFVNAKKLLRAILEKADSRIWLD